MENRRKIEVLPYDENWKIKYKKESTKVKNILMDELISIHHIGSTSILNMSAKPIIDILVVVKDIKKVDTFNNDFKHLGYTPMGEYGIKKRRFFLKGKYNRTHHIHIFEKGNFEINKHLNFRDFLRAHPTYLKRYADLKIELSKKFPYDIEAYCKGKDPLIKKLTEKANKWAKK
ncbi:MAG: GrpB family protein [Firmicutes bacterium]|nr:GrpB family protein [Bacillota bacterium]